MAAGTGGLGLHYAEGGALLTAFLPEPLQLGQVLGWVPFAAPEPPHSSQMLTARISTCFLQPRAASSKEMMTDAEISLPRRGALGLARRPPPPPKKEEKMSPRSIPYCRSRSPDSRPRRSSDQPPPDRTGVVPRPFLRVGQHLVRLVNLFEAGFGLLVSRIQVRVIFLRHLAVGFFDFILRGALLQPQHLIIITFVGHRFPNLSAVTETATVSPGALAGFSLRFVGTADSPQRPPPAGRWTLPVMFAFRFAYFTSPS